MNIAYGEKCIATALPRRFLSLSLFLFFAKTSKRFLRDDSFGIHSRCFREKDDHSGRSRTLPRQAVVLTNNCECAITFLLFRRKDLQNFSLHKKKFF